MADSDSRHGTLPFKVPGVDIPCLTSYKIFGDLQSDLPRLVIIHGGPGTGHEYLLPFAAIWQRFGMPVVLYDQIGCASSTHLPQTADDESLWQESLFIAELDNLLDSLGLRNRPGYHLLGQSWGAMLAATFAANRPHGLKRLVLASGGANAETLVEGYWILRRQLPPDVQAALDEEEQQGHFDSPHFQDAFSIFLRTYLCRAEPFPPKELLPSLKHLGEDTTVKETT